jgi:hypothetical protein
MHPLHRQFGWLRLAIALAVVGQLPNAASADSLLSEVGLAPPELGWPTPLIPADSGEPLPRPSFDVFAGELFAAGDDAPGLEFSLNPADEEILLGWRFEF